MYTCPNVGWAPGVWHLQPANLRSVPSGRNAPSKPPPTHGSSCVEREGHVIQGHLSKEDTVCSPNHIELVTNLALNLGHLSIQDSQLGPNGVLYREVSLYTGQPAESQW